MNMHQQGGEANGSVKLNAGIDVRKLHLGVCVGATQRLTAMLQAAQEDLVVVKAPEATSEAWCVLAQQAGRWPAGVSPGTAPDVPSRRSKPVETPGRVVRGRRHSRNPPSTGP